jgi:hypothetical protein
VRLITQLHLVFKGEYSYTSSPGCLYDLNRKFFISLVTNLVINLCARTVVPVFNAAFGE